MDNRLLVEKAYNFYKKIKNKDNPLAQSISNAFLPLLEYKMSLGQASEEDLLKINGIGPNTVDYFLRIFNEENIESIIKDVPIVDSIPAKRIHKYNKQRETKGPEDYSDNEWDNIVKAYESL